LIKKINNKGDYGLPCLTPLLQSKITLTHALTFSYVSFNILAILEEAPYFNNFNHIPFLYTTSNALQNLIKAQHTFLF
jgi:hypothetical protein